MTLRTAATNLADFADHDLHPDPLAVIAVLSIALAALVLTDRDAPTSGLKAGRGAPDTDARYWTTMLVAGVLGTALGDHAADDLGLEAGFAGLIALVVLADLLGLGHRFGFRTKAAYWITVVAVRTAGTNIGDWLASRHGLGLGLALTTTLTGLAFGAVVACWRPRPDLAWRSV